MNLNIMKESTQKEILSWLKLSNTYLAAIANGRALGTYERISEVVRSGLAPKVFAIGDQINAKWTDTVSNTEYEWPFNVTHFGDVTLEDGEVVPGMFLQAHYCSPFGVMFDQNEALYYTTEDLPAGTYYFTIGTTWGSNCVKDSVYYFTTTKEIPAGGQIRVGQSNEAVLWAAPDTAVSNWRIHTYSSPSSVTPLETGLILSAWTSDVGGTDLGTTTSELKYADSGINNLQRAGYGYNRWSQSGIRQYLNSNAAAGGWWAPQNNFDRPPQQLVSCPGFLSGFEEDFLNILKPVKVTTALNIVSDPEIGTQEDTYDTFFLASLEQQFITPQLSGVEGEAWEYWKRATGSTETIKTGVAGAFPLTYAINAKTSAQTVRLRSAYRSTASTAWIVTSSGYVGSTYAGSASRFSPACVVC